MIRNPGRIGFSGLAGSGKDTAANVAHNALGDLTNVRRAFAEPLKAAATLLGWTGSKEMDDPMGRPFLDYFGQAMRAYDPEFWITQAWMAEWDLRQGSASPEHLCFIYSDVRFPNEAEYIQKDGGLLIHIERFSVMQLDLESERHNDYLASIADCIISNDSTPRIFAARVLDNIERLTHTIVHEDHELGGEG